MNTDLRSRHAAPEALAERGAEFISLQRGWSVNPRLGFSLWFERVLKRNEFRAPWIVRHFRPEIDDCCHS